MTHMRPLISVEKLSVFHGKQRILSDVDLAVRPEEHLVICGCSGAGKTTLLRAIAGLQAPSAGRIEINGRVVSDGGEIIAGPAERGLAMVFQDLGLWPNLTVWQNAMLGLAGRKWSKDEKRQAVKHALGACRLEGLERRRPGELSSGEQQRAALARAVAVRPEILLLDEPFGSLDVLLKRELTALVRSLVVAERMTVVTVTHDPSDALELGAGRIAAMEAGSIVEAAEVAAVQTFKPVSRILKAWHGHLIKTHRA